jgi:hypothetical protein
MGGRNASAWQERPKTDGHVLVEQGSTVASHDKTDFFGRLSDSPFGDTQSVVCGMMIAFRLSLVELSTQIWRNIPCAAHIRSGAAWEISMRTVSSLAAIAALSLSALSIAHAKTPPSNKDTANAIVIVFKDGHRQTFNLADIARVEFTGAGEAAVPNADWPSRGRYIGRWVVGDGNGVTFEITLKEDGNAERSLHDIHGTWTYANGDALITWDDGAKDAIRKAGSRFQKYAYGASKSFSDEPDNVTSAQNTTPKPI